MFASFAEYEYCMTVALCVLALLGMGTTLTPAAFRDVATRPRAMLLILCVQLVIAPLVAIGLSRLFHLSTGVAAGMLLVTALPGGLFSNVFALLSRCSVALSVAATSLCTLGALVTTTFVLKTFGSTHFAERVEMPLGEIVFEISVNLLLPLLAGMAVRRWRPRQAKIIGRFCVRAATVLLIVYVVAAFQSGRIVLSAYGWRTHVAIISLDVLQILACFLLSWPFRVSSLDMFTAQIEVVVRNVHLGLLLKASLFPAAAVVADGATDVSAGVLFALLYYGGASIVTGVIMTIIRRIELRVMGDRHRAPPPPELRGW